VTRLFGAPASIRRGIALALLALAAAAPAPDAPQEMVGLFVQGCMPFVGRSAALRAWADKTGLPALPNNVATIFLRGATGQAFDGSNGSGKFALVSSDDGLCSVVTDQMQAQPLTQALEDAFTRLGLRFKPVIERDDAREVAIHQREYLATLDKTGWRILVATVKDGTGEAMLTGGPE